jgi:hypothetical protein
MNLVKNAGNAFLIVGLSLGLAAAVAVATSLVLRLALVGFQSV